MRRLAVFLVVAGCAKAIAPKAEVPTPPAAAPSVAAAPAVATTTATATATATDAGPPTCALTDSDTIDDGEGALIPSSQGAGSMVLDDVRVLASGADDAASATIVTWTRRAQFPVGDSWRTPHMAIRTSIRAPDATLWKKTTLPVLGYACATYGTIAPNTLERPFVAWGVANSTSFELWKDIPSAKDPSGTTWEYTTPLARVPTPRSSIDHFVASRDVTLAMATEETCDVSCTCTDPARYTLAVRSLDPKQKFSVRLGPLEDKYEARPDAPALAMGPTGGIAAYRYKKQLFLAWLDASGRPLSTGKPVAFADGDVGAPAVALAGTDAIVVWGQRPGKDAPYRLHMMRLPYAAAPETPRAMAPAAPAAPAASAFAPAVLADEQRAVYAWMEGDSGTHGEIHVAREWNGPSTVISGDETNARDPELSGTTSHPTIVWQTFPKENMAGVIRTGHLDCERR